MTMPFWRRRISILGSTGSVGLSTLDLVRHYREVHGPQALPVEALTAHRNVARLIEQAREFRPQVAAIADPALYGDLKTGLAGTGIRAAAGPQALIEAAAQPSDWVMAAIVGAAGLAPTLSAIRRGAVIALANKESLVCAGELVMSEVARSGARLLPVDSEHNAIFQVLDQAARDHVVRLILTASGGPFRTWTIEQIQAATPAQAIAHPTWSMGAKISVDCATLMNKGLELIEAHHLFAFPETKLEVLVHPQSVIHSLVAYADGSVLAQLGQPDMRTPVAVTLAWPERTGAPVAALDLARVSQLTFESPDERRFPCLGLARAALQSGGSAPTILNAANEIAVESFLTGELDFLGIARVVSDTVETVVGRYGSAPASLTDVHEVDLTARAAAAETITGRTARRRALG